MKALSFHEIHEMFANGIVKNGPLAGLRYPEFATVGSALYPKLLGSYESEIHNWLREICATDYSEIVDVGCAEGYYAVGLARCLPNAMVYAYDTDPEARRLCAVMAAANDAADRIAIRGTFSANDLATIPIRRRGLLICDCEGGEKIIFTESTRDLFANWDILIETHDLFDITISTDLAELLQQTHNLRVAASLDDIQKAKTYRYPELVGLDLATRRSILAEFRPSIMEWFFLNPKIRKVDVNCELR